MEPLPMTTVMDQLKETTAAQHRDAESRALQQAMIKGQLDSARYGAWLGQMFLIHSALTVAIGRAEAETGVVGEIVRDGGLHVDHLAQSLGALGLPPQADPLPSTAALLEAIARTEREQPVALLGYNYVLEGSMNGNRYIARSMARVVPPAALASLDPYGDAQRSEWGAYRDRMNSVDWRSEEIAVMVAAAQEMFAAIARMSDELIEGGEAAR